MPEALLGVFQNTLNAHKAQLQARLNLAMSTKQLLLQVQQYLPSANEQENQMIAEALAMFSAGTLAGVPGADKRGITQGTDRIQPRDNPGLQSIIPIGPSVEEMTVLIGAEIREVRLLLEEADDLLVNPRANPRDVNPYPWPTPKDRSRPARHDSTQYEPKPWEPVHPVNPVRGHGGPERPGAGQKWQPRAHSRACACGNFTDAA